jgi:hypothetical protein
MKIFTLIFAALTVLGTAQAQQIPKSQVPSIVLNNFDTQFPKATDVEWELKGALYLVDFETNWNVDHEIWYDAAGKMTKHREEIAKNTLPAAVLSKINTEFKGYDIDEAEKVTTDNGVCYVVELDAFLKEEWEVTLDENGTIISKLPD